MDTARQRMWSPEEIDLVLWCYEDTPTPELAALMDRPVKSIWSLARKLDLHKSRECIAEVARQKMQDPNHGGRKAWIQKGTAPPNKGRKMPPGWSPGRMRETQFRKGERSGRAKRNWMPVGATRDIEGWLYRKVSDVPNVAYTVNWKPEHVLRWEKKRGPVPAGYALAFKDGNKRNFRLSNLEVISRAELMRRNTIHNLPEDLKEVIRLKGAIKRRVTTLRRHDAEK